MKNNFKYISASSMVLMIVGVLLFLFSDLKEAVYIYTAGALVLAIMRLVAMARQRASNAVTRLPQIHLLSAISLVGAGYLMYDGSNSWSVLFIVSAVLEIYVSYRQK